MASLNIIQVTGYSAFKPSVLTFPFKTRRAVYMSSAPIRTNFSAYKHFGSPSRVNSVKARQSEHAQALLPHINARYESRLSWIGRPSFLG